VTARDLRDRIEARDGLIDAADQAGRLIRECALPALRERDPAAAASIDEGTSRLAALVESLRQYQAELHAQAEELVDSQARTEEALARFGSLFSHLPLAALRVALGGEVLASNERAHALFAFRPRGSSVRFLHRMIDPDDYQERVRPAFHEALAAGASACGSVEFVGDDGRRFQGEIHIASLPAHRAAAPEFACVVVDRSEQIETMQRLRLAYERLGESEAFLADSATVARVGGWDHDVGSSVTRWSPQLRVLLELPESLVPSLEAMVGLIDEADQAGVRAALEAAVRHGEAFDLEAQAHTAGGRSLVVRLVGHPRAIDGCCVRVTGVVKDVSRYHALHREIGDLTGWLALANEAGGIGIWDWDLETGRLHLDRRMQQLLGVDAGPAKGLPDLLAQLVPEPELARAKVALAQARRQLEPVNVDVQTEGDRHLHLAARAQFDGRGRAVRLVGCAWDSTREHEAARLLAAKDAAESASRAKSAFLSRMSHELRTPLNAILGFSQLMKLEAERGDLQLKPHRIEYIETAARHLLELITELLDVSRIEAGRMTVAADALDVAAVVQECLPLVQCSAGAAGVRVAHEIAAAPPLQVRGDRLRLKEVLINLLSNAVKYNRPGGVVLVSARAAADEGSWVEIGVRDTGVGLAPEQIAQLFQPFSRAGAEATRIEGTGMGLFVSKRFVELMGGTLSVDSRPGVGSTFTVRLPSAA
jgi:signal transduction histidine kinase